MKEIRLRDGPSLGLTLLAEEMNLGVLVDGGTEQVAVSPEADRNVFLGDHQHAAGAAAGVGDGPDRLLGPDLGLIAGQHQIDHQVNDVPGGEVLTGVLVQRLVELPDQLLEDRAHGGIVDPKEADDFAMVHCVGTPARWENRGDCRRSTAANDQSTYLVGGDGYDGSSAAR